MMPMDRVAERVAELAGPVGLDVIGLGCGDGKDEVRLTQCLLEHHKNRNLRLYLLDISQPLCCAAYRHAAEVVTALPMSAAQSKGVAAALRQALGKDPEISTRVDPAILGGIKVRVGSRLFDASLKSKLDSLKFALKRA